MRGKNRRNILLGPAIRKARHAAAFRRRNWRLNRTYVSQLENGHKSPTVDVLFRIGPVLGMAASELICQVERSLQARRK